MSAALRSQACSISPLAIRFEAGDEPIPGYHLVVRLGVGAFGEVWKAKAPGGLLKAIKFVRSVPAETGANGSTLARQELCALQRIQAIRHPFLLSLERYELRDDYLVIVTELADQNLWQRHAECIRQGLPGIPRFELLRYVREAAEALDLLNLKHGLQHLDVKPENLFLIHQHVKVADFGLMTDLAHQTAAAGGTPAYAAPEIFRGTVSRTSDQYSLAIVFQELLTGKRPFAGPAADFRNQHLNVAPDLHPLPVADRTIIGRALAKRADERFPCCGDLVRALAGATERPSVSSRGDTARGRLSSGNGMSHSGQADNAVKRSAAPSLEIPEELRLVPMEHVSPGLAPARTVIPVAVPVYLQVNCPFCAFEGFLPEKLLGRKIRCRSCSGQFVVGEGQRTAD